MSVLGVRWISSAVARTMQASMPLGLRSIERENREVFPEFAGIAPALVITPELDRLHDEGARYAHRLEQAGALVEHVNVPDADHAYDLGDRDRDRAREVYAVIARRIRQTTAPGE